MADQAWVMGFLQTCTMLSLSRRGRMMAVGRSESRVERNGFGVFDRDGVIHWSHALGVSYLDLGVTRYLLLCFWNLGCIGRN